MSKNGVRLFDSSTEAILGKGFWFNDQKYVHYSNVPYQNSAFFRLSTNQKWSVILMIVLLALSLLLNWHTTLVWLITGITLIYFADLIFQLFLVYRSFAIEPEIKIDEEMLKSLNRDWPSYTIFCPLYKEWQVLSQFIEAMKDLDYPEDKLQIMLLLEEDDEETINHVRSMDLPVNFETVIVSDSKPKTKPKALNYGLRFARGEICVIYDAEDIPDRLQLKKVVLVFEQSEKKVVCVQAKLNFYNPHQNLLTRLFSAEYSAWFNLVLTGLQSISAPIPLGGTSNHFRTEDIKFLGGWDAFNVTEDADLGMRIAKAGLKTAIVDSTTMEEANSDFRNWMSQRARWNKGYIQTYLVHSRNLNDFLKKGNFLSFITFQLVIGGKILCLWVNPIMWGLTISYFTFRPFVGGFIESLYEGPIFYMAVFTLIIGNFLYTYYFMMGVARRGQWELIPFALLTPVYWLMMSWASFVSIKDLIFKPFHWNKTLHGLHLEQKNILVRAQIAEAII